MSEIICVTNRKLACGDYYKRIESIAAAKPDAIILREKDIPEEQYMTVAKKVTEICKHHSVTLIIHTYISVAKALGIRAVHLPLPVLRSLTAEDKKEFSVLGASCHSTDEAQEAVKLRCTYITLGHIYETDCKKGFDPKGIGLLKDVSAAVNIPVYAIGGITTDNFKQVISAGAAGACIMSGFMKSDDPDKIIKKVKL